MNKIGSGEIQFQGVVLDGGTTAICFCHHKPPHTPNKHAIQNYLVGNHVDLEQDFSLVLDGLGENDTMIVFGNSKSLGNFRALVTKLESMSGGN